MNRRRSSIGFRMTVDSLAERTVLIEQAAVRRQEEMKRRAGRSTWAEKRQPVRMGVRRPELDLYRGIRVTAA